MIISTCHERLSEEEFVKPIVAITKERKIVHYLELDKVKVDELIIICGTALADDEYLKHLGLFRFLKDFKHPVLGICSGMQIIAMVFGGKLARKTEIGMVKVKHSHRDRLLEGIGEAYCLHNNSILLPPGFIEIAKSEDCIQAIKHKEKPMYGIMFHPEVRNPELLDRFIKLGLNLKQ
ncbi:MAG: C26 family cysteine hydrolase domain-containing family [Nanoarchaeota archaeon]|nr:C26 family cysteine hydrolase domain-containing family [Nanoarchaeota archaeon]